MRGMAFFHCDENSAAGCASFSAGAQCSFDGRAIIGQIDNLGGKKHRIIRRSWPEQFDRIFRSDRAWRVLLLRTLHQMIGGCPITMAIEQRANDTAIQNALEGFVFSIRFPFRDDFTISWEAPDM